MSDYYYDILINEKVIATVGPSDLKQLHISLGVSNEKPMVKAGGVSDKEGDLEYINWLEEEVDFKASLRIVPSKKKQATNPLMVKKVGQEVEDADEDSLCNFCNRTEDEAGKIISLGSSPLICAGCVKRCADLIL